MKKILLTTAIVFSFSFVYAQFTYNYLKAADDYFKKEDYYSAAQYYEKYLDSDDKTSGKEFDPYTIQAKSDIKQSAVSSWQQAVYNLAESYRMLNYHIKAEPVYKKVLEFNNNQQFPLARFHYATTLRALEKFDEAEKEFKDFLASYNSNDRYNEAANKEIQNLRFIRSELSKKDLNLYTVNKAPLNAEGATYAPAWLAGNMMLFTSTRPDNSSSNKTYTNRIYLAEYNNGTLGNINKVDLPQGKEIHQGVVSVTADGSTMFFTRWTIGDKTNAAIYSSKRTETGWTPPALLNNIVNTPGFNNQQPFVMPDGKHLLFSSDRTGGQGGFDLWYSELSAEGQPVNAVNLGSLINTKYDEQAPYHHTPSNTLVFSSNGRVGMGGYDFFHSKGNIGNWGEPVNFGYPVNSTKDDIYFTSRGGEKNILENVIFSSDRMAVCCLEMFAMSKIRPMKQIEGVVVSCQTKMPIPGATVNIIDAGNNQTIKNLTTGADGSYAFSLEDYQPLKISAASEGYHSATQVFNLPTDLEILQLTNDAICLSKIPVVGTVEVLENVYYEFNKAFILEESFASLDRLVALMRENPTMVIEISGHTDNIGSDEYNQKLSEARAQSVVNYLVNKGIERERMQAKGYGSKQPVAPNKNPDGTDNPEGRQKNRRTEFKVLKN